MQGNITFWTCFNWEKFKHRGNKKMIKKCYNILLVWKASLRNWRGVQIEQIAHVLYMIVTDFFREGFNKFLERNVQINNMD